MSATSINRPAPGAMLRAAEEYSVIRTANPLDILTSIDALISVTTAAKLLGVRRGTVCNWIARKTLHSFNIDNRLYVLRSEVLSRLGR